MNTRLTLRRVGLKAIPAAWFVPGEDVRVWFDELIGFGVELTTAQLLLVPRSRADRAPLGLMVVLPKGQVPHRVVRALPYACRADGILLPTDATLWPPVAEDEVRQGHGFAWIVFHPAAGCVGFAAGDVRSISDLMHVELHRDEGWDRALPGIVPMARLVAIEPEVVPDAASVFMSERGEIGATPPSELPPLPREQRRSSGQRALQGLRRQLARFVLWATRHAPRTAAHPTWINRLESWASGALAVPTADEELRRREVYRLLDLLAKNPDEGLKFALPVGGDLGRGIAPPSNQLGPRNVDFDLRQLGGGRAADAWSLPGNLHWKLRRHYRELANREIGLGRHRRAAYIFAHLLGEQHLAATTLRDGGFFREAAVLFHERLDDEAAAVQCLVRGGLLGEAALLEEAHRNWESAGDLRLQLGQEEEARALYTRARAALLEKGDVVAAAVLQAAKLHDVDGGLVLLQDQWNEHADPRAFAAWLSLGNRVGRADDLQRGVREIAHKGERAVRVQAAQVLGAFARTLSPGELLDGIRDGVRCVVAADLPQAAPSEQRILLEAMRRASPDDRVLGHDTRRILALLGRQLAAPPSVALGAPPLRLVRLQRRLLPAGSRWSAAAVASSGLVVAGRRTDRAQLRVATWPWQDWESGTLAEVVEHLEIAASPLQLLPTNTDGELWLWHQRAAGSSSVLRRAIVAGKTLTMSHSRGMPAHTVAVVSDDDGSLWALVVELDDCVLHHFGPGGALLGTHSLPIDPSRYSVTDVAKWCHLVAIRGHVVIAVGDRLCVRDHAGKLAFTEVPQWVGKLVRSAEGTNPRVLVGFENGFTCLDVTTADPGALEHYAQDLIRPTLGWTRLGVVLAIDQQGCQLFRTKNSSLIFDAAYTHPSGQPFAISPTPDLAEVVLVSAQTVTLVKIVG